MTDRSRLWTRGAVGTLVVVNLGLALHLHRQKSAESRVLAPSVTPLANAPIHSKSPALASLEERLRAGNHEALSRAELDQLSVANPDELLDFCDAVNQWLSQDREAALAFLERSSLELAAAGSPGQALDLLGYYSQQKTLQPARRRIIYDLTAEDSSALLTYLDDQLHRTDVVDPFVAATGVAVMANEHRKQFGDFLSKISALDSPEQRAMQGDLFEQAVLHTSDEDLTLVRKAIETSLENPQVAFSVIPLAKRMAKEDVTGALSWVAGLETPNRDAQADAVGQIMETLAFSDAGEAAELMSSGLFLEKFFPGKNYLDGDDVTPEAEAFFDRSLESYMQGLMVHHPDQALASVDAFRDPALRERYRTLASDLVLADSSEGKHHCKNCGHDH